MTKQNTFASQKSGYGIYKKCVDLPLGVLTSYAYFDLVGTYSYVFVFCCNMTVTTGVLRDCRVRQIKQTPLYVVDLCHA